MRISLTVFSAIYSLSYLLTRDHFNQTSLYKFLQNILKIKSSRLAFYAATLFLSVIFPAVWIRHQALETRAFDLGIFSQAVWNTTQGNFLYSSLKEGICLLGDHVSPVLAFIVPIYKFLPDPRILLVLQMFATAFNVLLIRRICKFKGLSAIATLFFLLAYIFYVPVRGPLYEDFHPEILVEPFMLGAFLFLEKKNYGKFLFCSLIVLLGKESMAGIVFMLGFYGLITKKNAPVSLLTMFTAVLVFVFDVKWVVPFFSHKSYLYKGFYLYLAQGHWSELIKIIASLDSLEYLTRVFSPLVFLSFFHLPAFSLTLPILAQNILSVNPVMRSFGYHYTIGLTPFVFVSSIYGYCFILKKIKFFSNHEVKIASLLLVLSILQSGPSSYFYYWNSSKKITPHTELIRRKLDKIDAQYSVLTHNNLVPQLANRKYVYQFEYNEAPTKWESAEKLRADYVVFDQIFWEPGTAPIEETKNEMAKAGYLVDFSQGTFFIFRKR